MAMITSTKHKIREHPWWVLSFGFYTAIDGLGEWGLFHVDDGGEGFQTFGFSLDGDFAWGCLGADDELAFALVGGARVGLPWLVTHHVVVGYALVYALTTNVEGDGNIGGAEVAMGVDNAIVEIGEVHAVGIELRLADVDEEFAWGACCGNGVGTCDGTVVVAYGDEGARLIVDIPGEFGCLGVWWQLLAPEALVVEEEFRFVAVAHHLHFELLTLGVVPMVFERYPCHLEVVPHDVTLTLGRAGDDFHHRLGVVEALDAPAEGFEMVGEADETAHPAFGWPAEGFAYVVGAAPIELSYGIGMVEVEIVVAKVADSHFALHEDELWETLVVFVPKLLEIVGANDVGIEFKLMWFGIGKAVGIALAGDAAIAVGVLAAGGRARGVDGMGFGEQALELGDAIFVGVVVAYLLVYLVAHAPDEYRRVVAVAQHLGSEVVDVVRTEGSIFAVVGVFPFVEEFVYYEDAVAISPIEHIFRVGIVGKAQTVAAKLGGEGREALTPGFGKRGCAKRSEVGMQAYAIDVDALAIDEESAIGGELYFSNAKGGLVGVGRGGSPIEGCAHVAIIRFGVGIYVGDGGIEFAIANIP